MGTRGNISDLDVLKFGGKPLVPLVAGFNRVRRSGVIRSDVSGGSTRQRKKYFNMPHIADVTFYLRSPMAQDFIQSFINRNEGKKFICHLSADRPIVEPYVVQAIGDWQHVEVNAIKGTVTCQFEIFSTSEVCLDEFIYNSYACMGEDMHCIIDGMSEVVEDMPVDDIPESVLNPTLWMPLLSNLDTPFGVGTPTFTRSSIATYIDRLDGLLKTAVVNEARFEAEGVLLEGESTNYFKQSSMSDAIWSGTRASKSTDGTLAPDGVTNAIKLTEDNTLSATHTIAQSSVPLGLMAGEKVSKTIHAKQGTVGRHLLIETDNFANWVDTGSAVFDLSNGNVLFLSVGLLATVTPLVNGWFRCSIHSELQAGASNATQEFQMTDSNLSTTYNGDGVSFIYVADSQIEALPFATSYIPTQGSPVTRDADNLSILSVGNMATGDYSVLATITLISKDEIGAGADRRKHIFQAQSFNKAYFEVNGSKVSAYGGQAGSITTSNITDSTLTNDIAITRDDSSLNMYINSTLTSTDTTLNDLSPLDEYIDIGREGTNRYLWGHIKNFKIFDVTLTSEEIANL